MKNKTLSIRIKESDYEKLVAIAAKEEDCNVSMIVRRLIRHLLKEEESNE